MLPGNETTVSTGIARVFGRQWIKQNKIAPELAGRFLKK